MAALSFGFSNNKSGFTGTKPNISTVIEVLPDDDEIIFCSMNDENHASFQTESKKCKDILFSEEFFATFKALLAEYISAHPSASSSGIVIVLPNRAVALDTVNVPTLRKKVSDKSLDAAISDLYRNIDDLNTKYAQIAQNRQYTTYSLSLIKSSIIESFGTIFSEAKLSAPIITYSNNALSYAATALNAKIRNSTALILDIKPNSAEFSFITAGVTAGFYSLPFGYTIMEHSRLAAEDMLFDHSHAELLVLNAKEKAKAKQLTMMQNDATEAANEMQDENGEEAEEETQDVFSAQNAAMQNDTTVKVLPKKQPRKLPQYMLRPEPHGEEEYAYENFRLFVKWALNLIQANKKNILTEKLEAVYINMPEKYDFLYDMVNEEKDKNGVKFTSLELKNIPKSILLNLEAFGGFYVSKSEKINAF